MIPGLVDEGEALLSLDGLGIEAEEIGEGLVALPYGPVWIQDGQGIEHGVEGLLPASSRGLGQRLSLPPRRQLPLQFQGLLFQLPHQPLAVEPQGLRLLRGRRGSRGGPSGHLRDLLYGLDQGVRLAGLLDEAVCPYPQGELLVLGARVGGRVDDHRDLPQGLVPSHPAAQLEAVRDGHEDVRDDQVEAAMGEPLQGLGAVGGAVDVVSFRPE
jgi:hypothetical protein